MASTDHQTRCFGNQPGHTLYAEYHDHEWGNPVYDDQRLFEMLILEGAQAGLNWETVLKKRDGYRQAFYQFNPVQVANMGDVELEALRQNPKIIRNRLKLKSARNNAWVFLQIQIAFGSFANYLWQFVDHQPILNHWKTTDEVPKTTPISDAISKDLKKRGMSFVGSTIIYAYMQAVGLVNDHLTTCWRYQALRIKRNFMKTFQSTLTFNSPNRGTFNITDEINRVITESEISTGLCHVFCQHTSACNHD